ncbi:hypothetical protein [Povalibacter sp.]|uniref:hypothetical protein n=1 Tax=Povalibacter sp. TaxID=1962978 RepID=UPI002F3E7488
MAIPKPTLNIIGKANGVGLSRDLALLESALRESGYDVRVTKIDAAQARRRRSPWSQLLVRCALLRRRFFRRHPTDASINVMLEHVWSEYLSAADVNVAIPNPEWFDVHDRRMLGAIDVVWAKTAYTQQVFESHGSRVRYTGFDSDDRHDAAVPRHATFFHLAGKSSMKGTDRLLRVWARHPEWPVLTVVQHQADTNAPEIAAANIDRRVGYVDDGELRRLQNTSQFHLCLSLTEGWGHYIVEALGVGAITVTIDAAPMNELVTCDRGALVRHESVGAQRLATTYYFDEGHFEATVAGLLALTEAQRTQLSQNSRRWFLENQRTFPQRLREAVEALAESGA